MGILLGMAIAIPAKIGIMLIFERMNMKLEKRYFASAKYLFQWLFSLCLNCWYSLISARFSIRDT